MAAASSRNKIFEYDGGSFASRSVEAPCGCLLGRVASDGRHAVLVRRTRRLLRYSDEGIVALPSRTKDNLVGPFWRPNGSAAFLLKGPEEKVFTV